MKSIFAIPFAVLLSLPMATADPPTWNLWPDEPPGGRVEMEPEYDKSGDDGRLVDGKRVIRLTNVADPQLTFHKAPAAGNTGTTVVVAPGGGFNILAYDLEGTEVAEWLNSIGVNAAVLKYRVPSRYKDTRWLEAVQDAQRAVSMLRSKSDELAIDPDRIGLLGFSAGGMAATITALASVRFYDAVDDADTFDFRPNFAVPIYIGSDFLPEECRITSDAPPFFMAIAHDDKDRSIAAAELYISLKKAGASGELHIYERGGHGYGIRRTSAPVTSWHDRLSDWMRQIGLLD
jgi:acetyl esterase/lipase